MIKSISNFFILLIFVVCIFSGCFNSAAYKQIGTGTPGVVEKRDWSNFDQIYQQTQQELDFTKRNILIHKAEDMIMDTWAAIPLLFENQSVLVSKDLKGVSLKNDLSIDFTYAEKKNSDTVRCQLISNINHFDYSVESTIDIFELGIICQNGLTRYTEEGCTKLCLAQKLDISEDGLVYKFTLRPNLKWSDGTPLGASDFVYSWKRAADPRIASDNANKFSYIAGYPDNLQVSASEDDRVFTVVLDKPCPFFLNLSSFMVFYPVKKDYVENFPGYKDENGNIINSFAWATKAGMPSSGAYIIKEWKPNENMVLEKNPYFWDADNVKINCIELMITSDASTAYAAYNVGDLDLITLIPPDEIDQIKKRDDFISIPAMSFSYLGFNLQSDCWAGYTWEETVAIRKAISMIIDRKFLTYIISSGCKQPAGCIIPLEMPDGRGGCFSNSEEYTYKYPEIKSYFPMEPDYAGSRKLLKDIGFEFNNKGRLKNTLSFELLIHSSSKNETVAACIQQDLREIGINIYVKSADKTVFYSNLNHGNFQMAFAGWTVDFLDPSAMLEFFQTEHSCNFIRLGK